MPRDPAPTPIVTDAELHAWLDGQLDPQRRRQVTLYLDEHPEDARRVAAWRAQKEDICAWIQTMDEEPVPAHLIAAARGENTAAVPPPERWGWRKMAMWRWQGQGLAAGFACTMLGIALGWSLRGDPMPAAPADAATSLSAVHATIGAGFAQRAAIAHAVYAADARRPVEIDANHEEQLVAWLSNRMGTPMRAPHLRSVGYSLEGGRLLPGRTGSVAQFMYRDAHGQRLTLYVSNKMAQEFAEDVPVASRTLRPDTAPSGIAFHFLEHAGLNVFYWIDGTFGYALSTDGNRAQLAQVSSLIYRQLARSSPP